MNDQLKRIKQSGFTLIEVMIASLILSMLVAFSFHIYRAGQDYWEIRQTQSGLSARALKAMDFMIKELRYATRTSTQNPSPNLVIPSTPNNKQIQFHLPEDKDSDGYITDATTGEIEWATNKQIQYQFIPGQSLLRRLCQGNQTTITNDVTNVEFFDQTIDTQLLFNELKIIINLSQTTSRQRVLTASETAVVKLRN